ncbi:MAG: hypothetical protein LW623_08240 [Sphingomonadaceae bacterium]|uniref:hypothetical protein n=1 Tax=Sphingorhabdus sp. TaxID=1902408 RepID=UPI0039BCEC79|nr:hypothetical protein [Sphingomonadaceae bacterium]
MKDIWVRRFIREPLVHFLAAGSVLFVLMSQFGSSDSLDRSITINEEEVARLASQWEQTWQRPPSAQQLDSLIRDYIKEEVYVREAMRLGLDVDDPIIRRRLRAKMEFLATAEIQNMEPTDAELQRYYDTKKSLYAAKPAFSFDQQFLGEDENVAQDSMRAMLQGKTPPSQALSVPQSMESAEWDSVSRQFGDDFANNLRNAPQGKQRVSNDWRAETQSKREAAAYQALLDGYDIRIAKP